MDYTNTIIYKILKKKTDAMHMTQYLSAVENICYSAKAIATQIVRTFPTFTLHNEVHFFNVAEIIAKLIGNDNIEKLTVEELSMLLLCSYCHDLGMTISSEEKRRLTNVRPLEDAWKRYFSQHVEEKNDFKRLKGQRQKESFLQSHLPKMVRECHHERIRDIIKFIPWDDILLQPPIIDMTPLTVDDLCIICESHGNSTEFIDTRLDSMTKERLDLRMCAVLLRLGDILDFDASRAPKALYDFLDLSNPSSLEEEKSKNEWDKHLTKGKFVITASHNNAGAYSIPYRAECSDLDVYDGINRYFDWINEEFDCCNRTRLLFDDHLQEIIFPYDVHRKIKLNIESKSKAAFQSVAEKCTNWLLQIPIQWGPLDTSNEMQNANTCEALIALRAAGYDRTMEQHYNGILRQLLCNVTDKGLPSKTLNAETVVCTSMLLFLVFCERDNKTVDDFSKYNEIANNLWAQRNDKYGWGIYVSKALDDECINANTFWALKALCHYDVGKTPEFKQFVVRFYQNGKDGKWGFTIGDEPRVITTVMYLELYYEFDNAIKKAIDKYYDRKNAIEYIYHAFADRGEQVEIETLYGIDKVGNNRVYKAPWNHILIGYILEGTSLAYSNRDMEKEQLIKIYLRLSKIIKGNVAAYNKDAYYYVPDGILMQRSGVFTYPTMYLIYGISKLNLWG